MFKVKNMNTDMWIFPLVLCFICVSSNDEQHYKTSCDDLESCTIQKLVALGSSVLLPCTLINNSRNWVSWLHIPGGEVVQLLSNGTIKFLDPRSGRVKAFPNQGSQGNFSISIDELKESDLGCYRCNRNDACLQVELVEDTQSNKLWLLICICAGVAAFTLLSVCSYLISNHRKLGTTNNPAGASTEATGPSAPPQEIITPPVQEQQQGVDNSIYENDDFEPIAYLGDPTRNHSSLPGVLHDMNQAQPTQSTSRIYPNLDQFNFERAESQRTKLRFHRELMNRLRQTSFSRHYYVNQHELGKQQGTSAQAGNRGGARKKKAKENCEYKNPIYNRSTEQLNRL